MPSFCPQQAECLNVQITALNFVNFIKLNIEFFLTAGFLRIEMRISTWQTVNTCTMGQSRFCHLRSKDVKKEGHLHTDEKERLYRKMAKQVK